MAQTEAFPSKRLVPLDAFRGATIALMVLVTLSLGKRLAEGAPKAKLLMQAARRALIIYVLGLVVYAWPIHLSTQRLLGVLQRIAICYFIAAAIYLYCKLHGQLMWLAGLLIVYWLLMTLIPVPCFGAGRLDVEGNLAHYIDRIVLGAHNYASTKTWDPEGIVSTLPAIATALLGVMAGHLIRVQRQAAGSSRLSALCAAVRDHGHEFDSGLHGVRTGRHASRRDRLAPCDLQQRLRAIRVARERIAALCHMLRAIDVRHRVSHVQEEMVLAGMILQASVRYAQVTPPNAAERVVPPWSGAASGGSCAYEIDWRIREKTEEPCQTTSERSTREPRAHDF